MALQLVITGGQLTQPTKQPSKIFKVELPDQLDFTQLIVRTGYNFETAVPISSAQFEDEFKRLRQLLAAALPGISQNVILPGLMPPSPQGADLGSNLAVFIKAVERGCKAVYPNRVFFSPGNITNRVTLCENTGHERFLNRKDWTIFAYVADCMRSWPVTVQRNPQPELIQVGFSVAGGYDGLSVLALHPQVLASGFSCPGIDYSGVQVDNGDGSLYAAANDREAGVNVSKDIDVSLDFFSGALSFLGLG